MLGAADLPGTCCGPAAAVDLAEGLACLLAPCLAEPLVTANQSIPGSAQNCARLSPASAWLRVQTNTKTVFCNSLAK